MKRFEGTMTALATPFQNGAFDEEAYRRFVAWQLDNGIDVLVPIGTTGEAMTMSAEERFRVVKVCVEAAEGRAPVIAGAGSNSTQEAIASVRQVREAGADAALVVTPYYNKPTQAGLVEHYRAIVKAHPGYPIVLYNVPSRTSVDLHPDSVARLLDLPEIVAIKEATGSMVRAIDLFQAGGDRLTLISGEDLTILPFIACGGKGVISVVSNVAPRMTSDLVKAARAGEVAKARELQVKLNRLIQLLFVETSPAPVKRALHLMKKFGPEIRLPLVPMTEGNSQKLEAELKHLGLL